MPTPSKRGIRNVSRRSLLAASSLYSRSLARSLSWLYWLGWWCLTPVAHGFCSLSLATRPRRRTLSARMTPPLRRSRDAAPACDFSRMVRRYDGYPDFCASIKMRSNGSSGFSFASLSGPKEKKKSFSYNCSAILFVDQISDFHASATK